MRDVPLHLKIAAGLTTGAIGIMIANPTDLVKVRMQAEGKLAAGCVPGHRALCHMRCVMHMAL